jgi:hypothetical protein
MAVNDPFIVAIAERVRTLVASEPARALEVLAASLPTKRDALQQLVEARGSHIDPALLIDVVATFVREFGIDPQWLLTGQYDPGMHRRALVLGEDRSEDGARAIDQFVHEQYFKLLQGER